MSGPVIKTNYVTLGVVHTGNYMRKKHAFFAAELERKRILHRWWGAVGISPYNH